MSEHKMLQMFLYLLIRDEITCGKIESIMRQVNRPMYEKDETKDFSDVTYSNKYIADYAANLAERLQDEKLVKTGG